MTTMERDVALKNIAENDKCAVIIVSILAGGVGKLIITLRVEYVVLIIISIDRAEYNCLQYRHHPRTLVEPIR